MHRIVVLIAAGLSMLLFSSCSMDWIYMFDRLSYESYITNSTGSDVTISYSHALEGTSPIFVKAGETVEVSDVFRWDLHVKTAPKDTVYFDFAGGESYIHVYERTSDGSDSYDYSPEENNIFKVALYDCHEPYSWTETTLRPKKVRAEYVIR